MRGVVFPSQPLLAPDEGPPRAFGRGDILPACLLAASHLAMFWRVIFTPAMFFYRDVFAYSYPHAKFIREASLAGTLPYWNPLLNFGEPVLANPNFLFFYPSTLLLIGLPLELGYALHYVLHFILAGLGAYGLARRWGLSRLAAFFVGFVFSFSGPMLSLGNLFNHAAAAAWIPWALLLTDLAIRSESRRPWVLLTLVFTLQFLASEPFTLMATFTLSLAYALLLAGDRRLLAPANFRILAAFGVVGALMLALGAVELLPSFALLGNSRRGVEGLPFLEASSWSLHPLQLLDWIIPDFFGSAIDAPTLWTNVLSSRNAPYFLSSFVGFIPLFLALLGLLRARDRRAKFAGFSALVLLVLAFGRFTPVFGLAYAVFPPLGLVRFPVKLVIPILLLVALLAGRGADTMSSTDDTTNKPTGDSVKWLAYFAGAVFTVWILTFMVPGLVSAPAAWILSRTFDMYLRLPGDRLTEADVQGAVLYFVKMLQLHLPGLCGFQLGGALWLHARVRNLAVARRAAPVVFLLAMAQLAWVNSRANPTAPRSFYTYRPPVLDQFTPAATAYRYAYIFREIGAGNTAPDSQGFLNLESIPEARDLPPSAEIPFRDRMTLAKGSMLTGAEGVMNIDVERSFPVALYDYWVFALKELDDPARTACLLGRSNIRFQVMKVRTTNATQREIASIFNGSPDPHYLYENLCALPRAFAAGKAVSAVRARDALLPLSDPEFDAIGTIFVPEGAFQPDSQEQAGRAGEVEVMAYTANEIRLRATMARPGYVALLDRFDPNWRATVDGRETGILRANHIFRAVSVREGTHEVRFQYEQRGLRIGLAISLAAAALLAFLYFRR